MIPYRLRIITPDLLPLRTASFVQGQGGLVGKDENAIIVRALSLGEVSLENLSPRHELIFIETHPSDMKLIDQAHNLERIATETEGTKYTHAKYISLNTQVVGSLYRLKRYFFLWATPVGLEWLRVTPDLLAIKKASGWGEMGTPTSRHQGVGGDLPGSYGLHIRQLEPLISENLSRSLRLWEHVHGEMPPMLVTEGLPRPSGAADSYVMSTEASTYWLAWSMGLDVNAGAQLDILRRPLGQRSNPYLAAYALHLLSLKGESSYEVASLF